MKLFDEVADATWPAAGTSWPSFSNPVAMTELRSVSDDWASAPAPVPVLPAAEPLPALLPVLVAALVAAAAAVVVVPFAAAAVVVVPLPPLPVVEPLPVVAPLPVPVVAPLPVLPFPAAGLAARTALPVEAAAATVLVTVTVLAVPALHVSSDVAATESERERSAKMKAFLENMVPDYTRENEAMTGGGE
ncbi:hypothetical protein C2E23DRAFT_810932 [Lenzites betulinus]|nr:hypothetical protein C2E23DRAFT_810932 [Lenzites betulinus]